MKIMRFIVTRHLIIVFFVGFVVFQDTSAFASRKLNQLNRGSDTERALSSNEAMLLRFKEEREQILNGQHKDTHLFQNRLKILDNKIDFLEKEINRTKAAQNDKKQPELQQNSVLKPLSPKLKGSASTDHRRGYMLAWNSNVVDLKPTSSIEKRLGFQEAVVRQKVEPLKELLLENRESPSRVALNAFQAVSKTQPSNQPPVLIKVDLVSIPDAKPGLPQNTSQSSVDLEAQASKKKNKSHKTGADWQVMSAGDKEIYVLSIMGNLSKHDVYLMKPYTYYIQAINSAVEADQSLGDEYVYRILMQTAYANEPDSRKDLQKVWK